MTSDAATPGPSGTLEAEQIRDAMLAVSGELKSDAGGPGVPPNEPRRTIYTRFMRNTRDPLADVFDAPLWFASAASRDTTTTPVQALLLANSAALRAQGKAFAARVTKLAPNSAAMKVDWAYRLAFGRSARNEEMRAALDFLSAQTKSADVRRLTSGQAAFVPEKVPYRDGQGAFLQADSEQTMFHVEGSAALPVDGAFTIEAFMVPRSVSAAADLRTIAAKWTGVKTEPGWTLGVTGQQSRRKPLTLALQMVGRHRDGSFGERPIFSDLNVQINKPYFVAAAFTPATAAQPGRVLFALKDLSNDDEPLLTATVEHDLTGEFNSSAPVTLGARSGKAPQFFHGVIDDVRLSRAALTTAQMLYGSEAATDTTLGFWRFEARPDVLSDASGHGHALAPALIGTT